MANDYYEHSAQEIEPGTTARASDVNSIGTAMETGLDKLPTEDQFKNGTVNVGADTGSANTYVVAMTHTRTALADGMKVQFKVVTTNTLEATTLNVDSLGAKSLKRTDGSNPSIGDLVAGSFIIVIYESSSDTFIIQSSLPKVVTDAALEKDYAEEWATKAEDSLVSTDAGGDGATDYSALHHAAKGSASASAAASSASDANTAKTAAETAQTAAETAKTAAELAETNAETAQTGAETAQTAAASSATAAAASETAAQTAQTGAETAQTAAELAETNAETAETGATTAKTAAETAQSAAETAQTGAEVAETNAGISEANASVSATEAAASASLLENGILAAVNEVFPGITTAVAVSNIYEPFAESDWPMMMEDKSWHDEDNVGGDGFYWGTVTTTEKNALSPSEGDVCYDSTLSRFDKYLSSAWAQTYRGPQRQFPSRAVAVAEANKVIIYDLTQSEPVMWRVFSGGSYKPVYVTGTSSVVMKGGIIFVGNNTTGQIGRINLLEDWFSSIRAATAGGIHGINKFEGTFSAYEFVESNLIVQSDVNDIAITQLDQDAHLVDEYGVVPVTSAAGTDGDATYLVSVIRSDGNIYDVGADGGYTCTSISISSDNELIVVRSDGTVYVWDDVGNINADGVTPDTTITDALGTVSVAENKNLGSSSGLTIVSDAGQNRVTTDYQSGIMPPDIKGAFLADSDSADVTGSELVTNGDFPTDTTGWTPTDATLSVVANRMRVTNSTGANGKSYQEFTGVVGKTYTVFIETLAGTSTSRVRIGDGAAISLYADENPASDGIHAFTFVATGTTISIQCQNVSAVATEYSDYDNISCRLADIDRSVNGNGLQINGTITKTALGTDGSSLVAYSGYSAANYLEQPYNADLDFGIGDFYVMGWFKENANSATELLLNHSTANGENGLFFNIQPDGDLSIRVGSGSAVDEIVATAIDDSVWRLLTVVRRSGVVHCYLNDVLEHSFARAGDIDPLTSLPLYLGGDASFYLTNGSLALWRIGAGAPSSEDIEFIYKQEKPLIVNGAGAVLGGSSDAIASIAWDDYKNQLKVQSADTLTTLQGSTVVATEASTNTLVEVSRGEVING